MFMESLVLPAAPGEEGKEGHGRGPAATWGEQGGHGGAAEGRGRLPSPAGRTALQPDARPRARHAASSGIPGCTWPLNSFSWSRSAKLFKAWGGQARARRGSPGCPMRGDGEGAKKCWHGNVRWAMQAGWAAHRHGSRKRHRGPAQCNK